jgi:hypothetical protein
VTWARSGGGTLQLRVRPLDQLNMRTIPGSESTLNGIPTGGTPGFMFWSPDGRTIAFFTERKLETIALAGGMPQELCDARAGHGGTWNRDGVIVFAPTSNGPLFSVPATGGTPTQVTKLDATREETSHRMPWFLPDGRHFLYLAVSSKSENSGIWIGSLDSSERKFLVSSMLNATFAPPGNLLFMNGTTLMAQAFDPKRLAPRG